MSKRIQVPTQEPMSIFFGGSWVGGLEGGFFLVAHTLTGLLRTTTPHSSVGSTVA